MTINEVKELQTYDILSSKYDTVIQILKQISDGYLVLDYSPNHRVFNVIFMSFGRIVEDEYQITNDYDDVFLGGNIRHVDDFGFLKSIE